MGSEMCIRDRDRQTGSRTRSERERGAREGGERERLGLGGRAHARKSSERSTCQPADGKGCASVRLPHLPCACRFRAARTHKVQGITGGATGQAAGKEGKPGRPKKRRASLRAAGFPVFFCRDPVSPDSPDPTASLATHQELISSAFSDEEACAHGRRSGTVCARTCTTGMAVQREKLRLGHTSVDGRRRLELPSRASFSPDPSGPSSSSTESDEEGGCAPAPTPRSRSSSSRASRYSTKCCSMKSRSNPSARRPKPLRGRGKGARERERAADGVSRFCGREMVRRRTGRTACPGCR